MLLDLAIFNVVLILLLCLDKLISKLVYTRTFGYTVFRVLIVLKQSQLNFRKLFYLIKQTKTAYIFEEVTRIHIRIILLFNKMMHLFIHILVKIYINANMDVINSRCNETCARAHTHIHTQINHNKKLDIIIP